MAASMKKPSVSFTLPIACQICLGKVKEPVVCSNQHVFCNSCMEVWLQHRSHCPTCRIPITTESPCKQILGGPSCSEDSEKRRSTPELRKMRFEILHREYEAEIETLQSEVNRLRARNYELEKCKSNEYQHPSTSVDLSTLKLTSSGGSTDLKKHQVDTTRKEGSSEHPSQNNFSASNFLLLTQKYKKISHVYQKLKAEMERMRQDNNQLRDTNAGYLLEIGRLKQSLTCKSPRKYEKYAQAAQQAKLDKSEQEVKQLKRALERTDVYVEELECKLERYKQAHGASEARANLSLELELDSFNVGGSRDSVKVGEDITQFPESPSAGDDCLAESPFKIEGDEPAAKRFYSNKGVTLHYSPSSSGTPSTSCLSRDTPSSPDLTLHAKFQESSKNGIVRGSGRNSLSDDRPSSSCVSSTTPSSAFSFLKLNSDTKSVSKVDSQDNAAMDAERGTYSMSTSLKKSPRRHLKFDTQTQISSRETLKIDHTVFESVSSASDNPINPGRRNALDLKGKSPVKRKLDDTSNDTLDDLDYTLTEEIVECTKLLKAAERRIQERNGKNSLGPSSSGNSSSS
ncbi:ORC ubiquitin ligase 1-like isoform X1 [Lytechinus pictus]|uniref:ORC ubiquitin ligase 1-like isoform X1 n=2 Tax=Lytechinus pictus TaxID=7653 RepID=UPI0030B9DCF9